MRKILYLGLIVSTIFLTGCDEDQITFNDSAAQFTQTTLNVPIFNVDKTVTLSVQSTTLSTTERTLPITVVNDDAIASEFVLGTVTIPANSYDGTATITFDRSAITGPVNINKTLVVKVGDGPDTEGFGSTVVITYFLATICNDTVLTINTDYYAEETGLVITDAAGTPVFTLLPGSLAQGIQTVTRNITLPDGTYTATITDVYADGQVSGAIASVGAPATTGNYSIRCGAATLVSAGGAFGATQSRTFSINQ